MLGDCREDVNCYIIGELLLALSHYVTASCCFALAIDL